mgnify:CR=1 FL=1
MMQGFYLLAMQQARRRTQFAALACLAAMISLVLAGRALLASPAVPASASITYTVQSENDRLVIRQSDGSVLRTGIDTRAACHCPIPAGKAKGRNWPGIAGDRQF